MKDWIGLWVLDDPHACRPHRPEESRPQLGALVSIPVVCVFDIGRQQLAERLCSLCVSFEAIQNLIPWDSSGAFTLKIIQSPVEFLTLR